MPESPVATPLPALEASPRELQAAYDIAHAFFTATTPDEVYHLALERVGPLVGAAFASVFVRDTPDELRLAAAWNWPPQYEEFLDGYRVRVGLGPTGRAVAENRAIEVLDIPSDPLLEDWREIARELDFTASVSLPLASGDTPEGAITFYFRTSDTLRETDRSLLRLVADQLSATAMKAHLIDGLQEANRRLRKQNVELEARYREAEEARRLKGEFMANISHELRTPLTAILGYTYLLREGIGGELCEEHRGSVDKIEASGTELLNLINDLLDLTHLQLGRLPVQAETTDAVALLHAVGSHVSPEPAPGVEVVHDTPEVSVPVRTDPSLVLRILRHLVSNAFKFTPAGRVTMRVRVVAGSPWTEEAQATGSTQHRVVWEVEDTGIGIDAAQLEGIFDEFRQVDGSPTRRYGGTGIGLALSRQLARRLGGDIAVRSTPGQGSVFSLSVPAGLRGA